MTRPIFYDATDLLSDAKADRFDRGFAESLVEKPVHGVDPLVFDARGFVKVAPKYIANRLSAESRDDGPYRKFAATRAWILGRGPRSAPRPSRKKLFQFRIPQPRGPSLTPPQGSVFMKFGLRGWENPRLSGWLDRRSDLIVVCVLRHLWELEFPEYVADREGDAAKQAYAAAKRRANVIISASGAAAQMDDIELSPPPSAIAGGIPEQLDRELADEVYFVQAGPIEARANTLMILQIWREFAHSGGPPPKLILAGERGEQIDTIAPMLDWAESIRPYIYEAPNLDSQGLRRLLAHSHGLLAPDFAASDNALARDASALGVKVIASKTPVFQALSNPLIECVDPIAGSQWRAAIMRAAQEPPRRTPDLDALPDWLAWRDELLSFVHKL